MIPFSTTTTTKILISTITMMTMTTYMTTITTASKITNKILFSTTTKMTNHKNKADCHKSRAPSLQRQTDR